MKTPERWRALPRRALLVNILAPKSSNDIITSRHDVTWRHDITLWHYMVSDVISTWICTIYTGHIIQKIAFFNVATLTFDRWPWPSNLAEILSRSFPTPNFVALAQTVQPWESWLTDTHTHRRTDGTDFIPSTADAGGKNPWPLTWHTCSLNFEKLPRSGTDL